MNAIQSLLTMIYSVYGGDDPDGTKSTGGDDATVTNHGAVPYVSYLVLLMAGFEIRKPIISWYLPLILAILSPIGTTADSSSVSKTLSPEASGKSFEIDCGSKAIIILAATYGSNCGATYNNQLNNLKAECNYANDCYYMVNHNIIGDPAVGCGKKYQYEYQCIEDSNLYEYVGCYRDTSNRALRYGPHAYGYTPDTCSAACAAYKYFALQNGGWCSCDNDLDYARQYGTMTTCPASGLGAGWANDLYENAGPERSTDCELGENYQFEGSKCIISGDPHFTMFNGNKHDLQMNPDIHNQMFLVAPCADSDDDDMPLRILGTVYRVGTKSVTGLDYVVVILTDTVHDEQFYVYLSSAFAKYTADTDTASTDYYANTATLTSLTSKINTKLGDGRRFAVWYEQVIENKKINVEITIDGKKATLYLDGQNGRIVNGIYRMHYGQIMVPSSLKCYTCGICGDFKRVMTGETVEYLETCSGGLVGYRKGWKADTPEAYDANGWTWEYNYAMNHCVEGDYDIRDNLEGMIPEDPCSDNIRADVARACDDAMKEEHVCCDFIGSKFCKDFVEECKVDACATANGDASAIDQAVADLFTEAVDGVCDDLALHEYSKFEGYHCSSSNHILSNFVGTNEECAQKCNELEDCVGFLRVNSGSQYAGKCYFRGGTMNDPYPYSNDDRDCYIPKLFDIGFEYKSTEIGCDGEEIDIGWVKYSKCEENAVSGNGEMIWPTLSLSEMIDLARYAVTVKILPRGDIPGQSETAEYAVTTCMCSNPIFALNNGKELSFELSYHSGLITAVSQYEENWIGSDTALDRLRNSCIPPGKGGMPRDLSTGMIYHACGNGATGLHLNAKQCMWEWKQVMNPRQDVAVWLGFYEKKHKKCEEYRGYETTAEPTRAPTPLPATTCSLSSYSLADDNIKVKLSQDGGATFEEYRSVNGWKTPLAFSIGPDDGAITENTVLRYIAINNKGNGGFVATLKLTSDQDPTQTTTFLTDDSQTNFQFIAASSTSSYTGNYAVFGSGALGHVWKSSAYPRMDPAAVINYDVNEYSYTTYEIDFGNFADTLTAMGCFEPTALSGYTKYEGTHCKGSQGLLGGFEGSAEDCAQKCDELDGCVGFLRVNSGSQWAGRCYFRGGSMTDVYEFDNDDRDCYVVNQPACELGEDYTFEGNQCIISGDPHFKIWNGDCHDFQGNPDINSQFFLVAPCFGSSGDNMPLSILGTFYKFHHSRTGMEYAVVILTDTVADEQFYVFFSSAFAAYTRVGGSTSTDYYENTGLTSLTEGVVKTLGIGDRFTVSFTQMIANRRALMEIGIDGEEATIYLDGQSNLVGGIYKMHYTQINIPSTLKCHSCGLCGDFKRPKTGQNIEYLESCSGGLVGYRAGWKSWITEAYDANGWTWEYNYATNYCTEGDYDITDNLEGMTPEDVCTDDVIADKVATACDVAYADAAECCEEIEDGDLCPMLLENCKMDVCVAIEGDDSRIQSEVEDLFNEAIDGLCSTY